MNQRLIQCVLLTIIVTSGCRAKQLQHDQGHMRARILELQTNQILDNLIRAKQGMPILHVDYVRITGNIVHASAGSLGVSQNVTDSRALAPLAMVSRVITDAISFNASGSQNNTLTVSAEPVLNNNQVYDAYLAFLVDPKTRFERLIVSPEPPPCGAAHIVRQCGEYYYWVPIEYKSDFLGLALATTVQRGRPLEVPEFFQRTIVKITPNPDEDNPNFPIASFASDLPNDMGTLTASVNRKQYTFTLRAIEEKSFGIPTKELLIGLAAKRQDGETEIFTVDQLGELVNQSVNIKLDHHFPPIPATTDLLRNIRNELEDIRVQDLQPFPR